MAIQIELDFTLCREHETQKGFFHPPFVSYPEIIVNSEGIIKNADTFSIKKKNMSTKGYCTVFLKVGSYNYNFPVHRIVAFTFIKRSEKHLGIPFHELQVNHKDGNKINNSKHNLEWLTNQENMTHARENGLFSNDKPVFARNIHTGKVEEFRSISQCERFFNLKERSLSNHLKSNFSGRLSVDGYVFSSSLEKEWPKVISTSNGRDRINYQLKMIAENTEKERFELGNSIPDLCRLLGLNINSVRNFIIRKGTDTIIKGWRFWNYDDYVNEKGELP